MGERFRDSAWDSQLDTMLDDLQQSVQGGEETHGYKNGHGTTLAYTNGHGGHTTREYQEKQIGNTREVREKTTRVAGGAGEPYSYREESQFVSSTSSSSVPMGSKRAIQNGQMEQHLIDEKKTDQDTMRGRSDSLVADLSSIAKVRSVSKSSTAYSSSERYEYQTSSNTNATTTSNTQQSIKKNINDLDHLLSNLSSHSAAPSRTSSKPASREGSPTRRTTTGYTSSHMSRTEERRERLLSNASQYRSPSLGRTPSQSRPQSRPHSPGPANCLPQPAQPYPPMNGNHGNHFHPVQPRTPEPSQHDFNSHHMTTSTMRSSVSSNNEFRPVHTTPDPLTGRYADGRITPNHGYTRNFHGSPMTPRKVTVPESNIPKKPDELLSSLGQEVDHREMQRITQEESLSRSQKEMMKPASFDNDDYTPSKNTPGPPVYYPTGDLFTKNEKDVAAREAELSAQGQYFSASYAREKGSKSKEESGEKGGAAVIPICLPLCCAAPCVIM